MPNRAQELFPNDLPGMIDEPGAVLCNSSRGLYLAVRNDRTALTNAPD
jgi:hypothetical protein